MNKIRRIDLMHFFRRTKLEKTFGSTKKVALTNRQQR